MAPFLAPPPLAPPSAPLPSPLLEAAWIASACVSALALLATSLAWLWSCCHCCRRRAPSSLLLRVALCAAPANVARIVVAVGDELPLHALAAPWWRCHVDGGAAAGGSRVCAALGLAHIFSIGAPLWAVALALHFMGRATCCTRASSSMSLCLRFLVCSALPILLCALAAADHLCARPSALPSWAPPMCNATGAPHLEAWAAVAGGLSACDGTALTGGIAPLALLGAPIALAFVSGVCALLVSMCAVERLFAQQLEGARSRSRRLQPLGASLAFFVLSAPLWALSLAHAAVQVAAAAAGGGGGGGGGGGDGDGDGDGDSTTLLPATWGVLAAAGAAHEASPWLLLAASAMEPAVGLIAILCWLCCGRRPSSATAAAAAAAEREAAMSQTGRMPLLQGEGSRAAAAAESTLPGGINGAINAGVPAPLAGYPHAPPLSRGGTAYVPGTTEESRPAALHPLERARTRASSGWSQASSSNGSLPLPLSSRASPPASPSAAARASSQQPCGGSMLVMRAADAAGGGSADAADAACALVSGLAPPPPLAGWLNKEGHVNKDWKRRWCTLEGGLFSYYSSEAPSEAPLGTVPLVGAALREPKHARSKRPSLTSGLHGMVMGPAWRLDTAARPKDHFHKKARCHAAARARAESCGKGRSVACPCPMPHVPCPFPTCSCCVRAYARLTRTRLTRTSRRCALGRIAVAVHLCR